MLSNSLYKYNIRIILYNITRQFHYLVNIQLQKVKNLKRI